MNRCSVCNRDDVREINRALIQGKPERSIASQFGIDDSTVGRHKRNCIPKLVTSSQKAQETLAGIDAARRLREHDQRLSELLESESVKPGDVASLIKAHVLVMDKAREWGVELPSDLRYKVRLEMDRTGTEGGADAGS